MRIFRGNICLFLFSFFILSGLSAVGSFSAEKLMEEVASMDLLKEIHDHFPESSQVIIVENAGPGMTDARITSFERTGNNWRHVLGPIAAKTGRNGFAPLGEKREGDGRTPRGTLSPWPCFRVWAKN